MNQENTEAGQAPLATPGPSNLNQKSIFEDFDNFWR
jgi:hypothetical protein